MSLRPITAFTKLGGLYFLPRTLDKIRVHARGELHLDHHAFLGKGFDGRLCHFLGISYEALRLRTLAGGTDEEILHWIKERGRKTSDVDLLIWNGFSSKRGWRDDATPTLSGTISAALATGDRLRIYNGDSFLGIASVNNTAKTWSFTPSTPIGNGFYAVSARVADAAGNLGAASPVQRFSIDSTSNQLIGTATANTLTATTAKDMLTGLGGIDTFSFTALSRSTLVNFDRITDFAIGTDVLDGPNAITAAEINKLGLADSLDALSISTLLTTSTFIANKAATFSYADPSGTSRSFIALNDGTAGYQSSTDAIIEITGYMGSLDSLQVI